MTFGEWWEDNGPRLINAGTYEELQKRYEACWIEAVGNAFVEMNQMRKAVIDHYGRLPEFLDEFLKARIAAVTKNAEGTRAIPE